MRAAEMLILVSALCVSAFAVGDGESVTPPSVWEQMDQQDNTVQGSIESLSDPGSKDRLEVNVKTEQGIQTLRVCNHGIHSARQQTDFVNGNPQLDKIKKAMKEGKSITFQHGGAWDSCIKDVVVEK